MLDKWFKKNTNTLEIKEHQEINSITCDGDKYLLPEPLYFDIYDSAGKISLEIMKYLIKNFLKKDE